MTRHGSQTSQVTTKQITNETTASTSKSDHLGHMLHEQQMMKYWEKIFCQSVSEIFTRSSE